MCTESKGLLEPTIQAPIFGMILRASSIGAGVLDEVDEAIRSCGVGESATRALNAQANEEIERTHRRSFPGTAK